MDSTIFDSGTENIYLDGAISEIQTAPANSMQWIKFVTEYEFDKAGNMTKSTTTTYEIPSVPVWEAFPPVVIETQDVESADGQEQTAKDLIDRNKLLYDLLARSMRLSGLQDEVDDGIAVKVLEHILTDLARRGLTMRISNE